ncbi:hypothetical protein N0V90_012797 [Kalmusia sp. IMI 367209]|nr:hypothetical protein N0V90_012797 [Kalmusia sp. IMI 367209]
MGGGAEITKRGRGLVLLAVIPFPEDAAKTTLAEIKEEFPDLEYHYIFQKFEVRKNGAPGGDVDVPEDLLKRVNVLVTISWLPKQASDIPNIKFIQFISAGTNHVSKHPIYTDSKIPLCSASGVHGPQIAEWVLMMDLVHNHNYIPLYELQRKKEWKHNAGALSTKDNVGRTVGILGYGSIGRQGESYSRICMSYGCLAFIYFSGGAANPVIVTLGPQQYDRIPILESRGEALSYRSQYERRLKKLSTRTFPPRRLHETFGTPKHHPDPSTHERAHCSNTPSIV